MSNSIKNLVRTEGIIVSCIGSGFLFFTSFFIVNVSTFMNYWYEYTVLESKKLSIPHLSASELFVGLLKHLSLFTAIVFIVGTTFYIKSQFHQIVLRQRSSLITMSLIGDTTVSISLYFSIQALLFTFVVSTLGTNLANHIFLKFQLDFFSIGSLKNISANYQTDVSFQICLVSLCSLFIFGRIFFVVRTVLITHFNNESKNTIQ